MKTPRAPGARRGSVRSRAASLAFLLVAAGAANAGAREDRGEAAPVAPVSYRLRFAERGAHVLEVDLAVRAGGRDRFELMMATWTPGSYLIREFARNVEKVTAAPPAAIEKTSKNRWRVSTGGLDEVALSYRVHCRTISVRSSRVEERYALLNGASVFITDADRLDRPHVVALDLPSTWKRSITTLARAEGADPHRYRARDFDELVDSPIVAGNPAVYPFEAGGRLHELVNVGEGKYWNGAAAARDVERIVETTHAMWRVVPYERYVFFNLLTGTRGGLEHAASTVMMTSRWSYRVRSSYLDWLGLVSHEFFHAWNVKRLRPRALARYDFEKELYTESLWIAEGITSYYDDLILARAGLCTRKEYLERLSKNIERLQTTPGRLVQSLSEASRDAWIKFYRADENTPNVAVSYYTKGAVAGFLLDAAIRRASGGARSLDDVMRLLYERHTNAGGYSSEEFRRAASEAAGADLSAWFRATVDSTAELEYEPALEWLGLRFAPEKSAQKMEEAKEKKHEEKAAEAGEAPAPRTKAWLGLTTAGRDGRLVVTRVLRGTPGFAAGLDAGDEIIAVDGFRVLPGGWTERLEQYAPGDEAVLLVARRQELVAIPVAFGKRPPARWRLEVDPDASADQTRRLEAWLRGR